MSDIKPILFNTEMVRAILTGRKTVTRRVVKPNYRNGEAGFRVITNKHTGQYVRIEIFDEWEDETRWMNDPCRPGDILYAPQPWKCCGIWDVIGYEVEFQDGEHVKFEFTDLKRAQKWAKYLDKPTHQWQSPYFMPREAARIFLRVTGLRVERLQDMLPCEIQREGCPYTYSGFDEEQTPDWYGWMKNVWEGTLKPADLPLYGWEANPWVFVISFERISKDEALQ